MTAGGSGSAARVGEQGGTALAAIQQSVTKVTAVHSVRVKEKITSSAVDMNMAGAVRYNDPGFAFTGQMTMGGTAGAEFSQLTGGSPMQFRMNGNTIYMNLGNTIAQSDGGKPWVSVDISKATGGLDFSKMGANMNPAQQLQELISAGDLRKVGQETVDGQSTTHYTGTVDPAEMLNSPDFVKQLGEKNAQQLAQMSKQAGITSEDVDVWVDGQQLPVREAFSEKTSAGTISGQIDLTGWGSTVDVTPPPASQTTQLPGSMGAGLS